MTEEERKLALHCLKASSDYHSEVCEECINYPNCDHTIQDDVTETIIKVLEQEPKAGHWIETAEEYYKAINEKGGGVNENTPYFTDDIACSECLAKFSVIDNETERFICCPNCGSKMESEGN